MILWSQVIAAFCLLTRLPVGRLAPAHAMPEACVWAYPVVGAVVGGLGAVCLEIAEWIGMSRPLAALWALAAMVMVTGGLHEDGLADTADGFGGGRTVERKLAIMRDSRIGSFGALALLFGFALRAVPLGTSPRPAVMLIVAGTLGRGAMLVPLLLTRPARTDGMAASLGASRMRPLLAGLAVALACAFRAPAACLAALAAGLCLTWLCNRLIGGYTGDVLGATEQLAECAAMALMG